MTQLEAMNKANADSTTHRCVQHVETIDGFNWFVSDWYDEEFTVYSFECGREL